MELNLGLAPPVQATHGFDLNASDEGKKKIWLSSTKKRALEEMISTSAAYITKYTTLALFSNDDEENEGDKKIWSGRFSDAPPTLGNSVVGWPPIRSLWKRRMKEVGDTGNIKESGGTKSVHVKVKMDGMGIGRKVDLSLHHSYRTLTLALSSMFGISMENGREKNSVAPSRFSYTLAYQDKEGDWMVAGDVPWGTFIKSVRRLKIQRKGE